MEGRGRCGPSAKLRDTGPLPFPRVRGKTPGELGRAPLPWAAHPACFVWRQKRHENPKTDPGKDEGRKATPARAACRVSSAPRPLVPEGLPHRHLSHEKGVQGTSREDHKIFPDTFVSHTLKHSTEVPKGKPGGRVGGAWEGLRRAEWGHCRLAKCWSGGVCLLPPVKAGVGTSCL